MLKTYRIIPLVFILFLFGFTLITVAPVFAHSGPEKTMLEMRIDRLEMKVRAHSTPFQNGSLNFKKNAFGVIKHQLI
jgi:hypothetical protein